MKKVLTLLLLALPMLFFVTACNDDDDMPDVTMNIDITGATKVDDILYVVAGDTINVNSITVTNNEKGKKAIITSATYFWDAVRLGTTLVPPYGYEIAVSADMPESTNLLQVYCPVYAVDKSPAFAVANFDVKVVKDEASIPSGGVTSFTFNPTISAEEPSAVK